MLSSSRALLAILVLGASAYAKDASVLILGGGVTGIIAARTLHEQGIDDFKIVEARDFLSGRLTPHTFGAKGKEVTIELGANWVQGTTAGPDGPTNPIWTLVQKHKVKTQDNDLYGSITSYDHTGAVDYLNVYNQSLDDFTDMTVLANERIQKNLVDLSTRAGYSMDGAKPKSPQARACEYWQFDFEYAATPDITSLVMAAVNVNTTYDPDFGGYGDGNALSIDQRGFRTFIVEEAKTFLKPEQVLLNSTVQHVHYSSSGVNVTLANGKSLSADYVLSTFSLGVLQNDDVVWHPELPDWKQEAIQGMTMTTYTKIFIQFPKKFWFDTEMGIYADRERGRYPVWQSLDHENFFPGSGLIFVTVTGDFSVRIEAMEDSEVQNEVMGVLHSMFPNITVPDPIAFFFPRWHSDPLFRGSYSNWPQSFFVEHHSNLRAPVDQRLWFAGEATSEKFFGFLHGAYFEGQNAGTELAKCIKGQGCVVPTHVTDIKNDRPYDFSL